MPYTQAVPVGVNLDLNTEVGQANDVILLNNALDKIARRIGHGRVTLVRSKHWNNRWVACLDGVAINSAPETETRAEAARRIAQFIYRVLNGAEILPLRPMDSEGRSIDRPAKWANGLVYLAE